MVQLCQESDNLSHLTGFWVISIVLDLLNFIVYVIAFMLLLNRVLAYCLILIRHLKIIKGYYMTRYPLRPHLKMLIYAMLWQNQNTTILSKFANTICTSHITNITNDWFLPNFHFGNRSVPCYHAICDCYGCLSLLPNCSLFSFGNGYIFCKLLRD